MNFKSFIVLFLGFSMGSLISAQQVELPQTVRKGIIYKKERSFIAAIQTNGYYFGYSLGKIEKYYLTKYLYFDFGHLKDSREFKINQAYNTNGYLGNYIYGKQNDLYNLRVGKGFTRYLSEKTRRKGVALGIKLEGGLLLGILKPYYIQVKENIDNIFTIVDLKYSEGKRDIFLDKDRILGTSGFAKGLGELRILPGGFGRIAISLDPGAFENTVKAINFGLSLDVYSKRVPILASVRNKFLFANFFLNIQFGRRH
ncbi:MAG: hypothetical protein ABIO44_02290 [Saprospiraceae bacterium]